MVATLRGTPVAQAFDYAVWTGRRGEIVKQQPSVVLTGHDARKWEGHPGFAWCFRRECWDRMGGVYAAGSMGTLDVALTVALLGVEPGSHTWESLMERLIPRNEPHYRAWYDNVRAALADGPPPGVVPVTVWHEFHGELRDRGYPERHKAISALDVESHLALHPAGYWTWTDRAPMAMRKRVAAYFKTRKEDG